MQRMLSRVHAGSCSLKDFLRLLDAFSSAAQLPQLFAAHRSNFTSQQLRRVVGYRLRRAERGEVSVPLDEDRAAVESAAEEAQRSHAGKLLSDGDEDGQLPYFGDLLAFFQESFDTSSGDLLPLEGVDGEYDTANALGTNAMRRLQSDVGLLADEFCCCHSARD